MNKKAIIALIVLCSSGSANYASVEQQTEWQTIRIETVEIKDVGKVVVDGSVHEGKISSLKIAAFGRLHELSKAKLQQIQNLPLSSITISSEAGWEILGGRAVHLRFKRQYRDEEQTPVTEFLIITIRKHKPDEVFIEHWEEMFISRRPEHGAEHHATKNGAPSRFHMS